MKGLVFGAIIASTVSTASAQESAILLGTEQVGKYAPETAKVLHDMNKGCNGIIEVHGRNILMISVQGARDGKYKEVLGADIDQDNLQIAASEVSVADKGTLELCIEDIESRLSWGNLDEGLRSELQEIVGIIKQPIEDPDGYDQLLLERKVAYLEEKIYKLSEKSFVTTGGLIGIGIFISIFSVLMAYVAYNSKHNQRFLLKHDFPRLLKLMKSRIDEEKDGELDLAYQRVIKSFEENF